MGLAAEAGHLRTRTGLKDAQLSEARVCYDHLAGQLATRLFDHLLKSGQLASENGTLVLTPAGMSFAKSLGIDSASLQKSRSPLCLECLDWSERRSHLAGSLGRAILARMESSAGRGASWIRGSSPSQRTGAARSSSSWPADLGVAAGWPWQCSSAWRYKRRVQTA